MTLHLSCILMCNTELNTCSIAQYSRHWILNMKFHTSIGILDFSGMIKLLIGHHLRIFVCGSILSSNCPTLGNYWKVGKWWNYRLIRHEDDFTEKRISALTIEFRSLCNPKVQGEALRIVKEFLRLSTMGFALTHHPGGIY